MKHRPGAPTKAPLLALLTGCALPLPEAERPPGPRPAAVHAGGLVVRTQADAEAACAAGEARDLRSLTITGAGVVDLSGLWCVQRVDEGLVVQDAPDLGDLDGLEGITDVGALSLAHLPALQDTRGLAGLARVAGDIGIWNVPALPRLALPALLWVEGDVLVQEAPALEEIDDLRSLGGLQGGLRLGGEGLADLSGLDRLGRVVGPVHLTGLQGEAALDGLARLTEAGGLTLAGAADLRDLDGLSELRRVHGDVVVANLPDLDDLTGLHGLQQVEGRVMLRDLPALAPGEADALADALAPRGIPVVIEGDAVE